MSFTREHYLLEISGERDDAMFDNALNSERVELEKVRLSFWMISLCFVHSYIPILLSLDYACLYGKYNED